MNTTRGWLALVALIAGCSPSEYIADYGLQPVDEAVLDGEPAPGEVRAFVFDGVRPVPSVRYEDDAVVVDWTLYSSTGTVTIENRTASPLRVIWSDTRMEGDFHAPLVLAEPGSYEERDFPQQPTVVGPAARARYTTIPGPPGDWQPFTGDENRGFWQRARPAFDLDVAHAESQRERDALAERAVGRQLRLVLALEIEGQRHELGVPARVIEANVRASYY